MDLAATRAFCQQLCVEAPDHLTVGLAGTLGAGKTQLVTLIGEVLGIEDGTVTSPTFALAQTYRGKRPADGQDQSIELHHVDAYRIADEDEWFEAGMEELIEVASPPGCGRWVMIEWANRFPALMPLETVWVELTITESRSIKLPPRDICLRWSDKQHDGWLERLALHFAGSTDG